MPLFPSSIYSQSAAVVCVCCVSSQAADERLSVSGNSVVYANLTALVG
jgi:hypothetical protein